MDEIFQVFVNPATIFVCLAAYVLTYVLRTFVQGVWADSKTNHYWNELFLPLGPIVNGALLGLAAKSFMWPDLANKTVLARMMYGAICGMFSALLYARVRSWLASKAEAKADAKADKMDLKAVLKAASPDALPDPLPSELMGEDPAAVVDAPMGGKGFDKPAGKP